MMASVMAGTRRSSAAFTDDSTAELIACSTRVTTVDAV